MFTQRQGLLCHSAPAANRLRVCNTFGGDTAGTSLCFAWESYDKSTSLELNLVFGPCMTTVPSGAHLFQCSFTHWPQFLSQNIQLLWCGILHRLQCDLTCWPPSLEWGSTIDQSESQRRTLLWIAVKLLRILAKHTNPKTYTCSNH